MDRMTHNRMINLSIQIKHLNNMYYKSNISSVDDRTYDLIYYELVGLERDHPELVDYDSPINIVGSDLIDGFKKIKHEIPMLSIKNVLNTNELDDWLNKCYNDAIVVEYKIDGCSLSLIYKHGILQRACTRGDGEYGDDITENAKMIKGIPLVLNIKDRVEVRGEVYIDNETFETLNVNREYQNSRNLTSGSLKLHNPLEVKGRNLKFKAFQLFTDNDIFYGNTSQLDSIRLLKNFGFDTTFLDRIRIHHANLLCHQIYETRDQLPYRIDGIVFKVNYFKERNRFTSTSKYHNWQIAYKFPQPKVTSTLLRVVNQVGRTGIITPVAIIKPIRILDTTVERATLHNYSQIKKLGLCIGDEVIIEKGGDIIPKIIGVEKKAANRIKIEYPTVCPECNGDTEFISDKQLICTNYDCKAKLSAKIEHFVSKHGFNINGFGTETINKLVKERLIEQLQDIFYLTVGDIQSIEGFTTYSAQKLVDSIQESKIIDFNKFIYALGIPTIGRTKAKLIAKDFNSIDNLIENYQFKLNLEVEGLGEVSNYEFSCFLSYEGFGLIEDLINCKVKINSCEPQLIKNHFLNGKKIIISGVLSVGRDEMKSKLEGLGAIIVNSISKKTDYLLLGANPGSKYEKALNLGTKIITEEEL